MGGRQCFFYDGVSSAQYGLWAGYVNESPEDANMVQIPYSYELAISPSQHVARISQYQYEETLSFPMEIISDFPVSPIQEREIFRWLIDSPKFKKLEFFNYGSTGIVLAQVYYNCILSEPKRIFGNNGIIGWEVTVITDAPYGWAKKKSYSYSKPSFCHWNGSDEPAYTYPTVTIKIGTSGGDIGINNRTTGETFAVKGALANDTIQIDEYRQITSQLEPHIYGNCSGKIRLVSGKNQFSLTGDIASITFAYSDARKVGYY